MLLLEAVIVIVFFVAVFLKARQEAKHRPHLSYVVQARLLTPTEERFHHVLSQASQGTYHLACKVRVADVLKTQPFSQAAFNKISAKHFDFVLCDKSTTRPVLAIELDDPTHRRAEAQKRDGVKDAACHAANLPLLRVPVQPDYDRAYLQKRIAETINNIDVYNA